MTEAEIQEVVERVVRGDLDPVVAATQLRAGGQFMFGAAGSIGIDTGMAGLEGTLRFQALMGRLMWVLLSEAGAAELPEPTTHEEYRALLAEFMAASDEAPLDP